MRTTSPVLTYSTIVFCSSTGKAKIAGSSEALGVLAAGSSESGWNIVSRVGVLMALLAHVGDMMRRRRGASAIWCRCRG